MGEHTRTDAGVPPELSCPLCLDLLFNPVSTPCGHQFCRLCISRARGVGHSSCPLCRRLLSGFDPYTTKIDAGINRLIALSVPADVVARRRLQATYVLEVVVGNVYEEVAEKGKNRNKWTMLVSLRGIPNEHTSSLIDKVVYRLPPPPSVETARAPHFSLCRYGWGTFIATCEIHWNRRLRIAPTKVNHHLVLEGDGGRTSKAVDFDPEDFASMVLGESPPRRDGGQTFPRPPESSRRRAPSRTPPTFGVAAAPLREEPLEFVVGNWW